MNQVKAINRSSLRSCSPWNPSPPKRPRSSSAQLPTPKKKEKEKKMPAAPLPRLSLLVCCFVFLAATTQGTDQELEEVLFGAIKNVHNALKMLQLEEKIEVSMPHSAAVFANSFPPSYCTFKEDVLVYMKPILEFFSQINSPFYINAYPFLAYKSDHEHINMKYALYQLNSGVHDAKTGLHYDNMFDTQIDAANAALEAAGYPKMEVRVSETGWASASDENESGATVMNAMTYNNNLRKRLLKKKGTLLRPKMAVKAYVFALFNENLKPGPSSEKHYRLFNADGSMAVKAYVFALFNENLKPGPSSEKHYGLFNADGSIS